MEFRAKAKRIGGAVRNNRRGVLLVALAAALVVAGVSAYFNFPVYRAGGSRVTFSDISNYKAIDNEMARAFKLVPKTWKQSYSFLANIALAKEILAKKDIHVVREPATNLVNANMVLRGTLDEFREDVGEDGYYRAVVEPLMIDSLFTSYYLANDPNRKRAEELLVGAVKANSLAAVQEKEQVVEIFVPVQGNEQLAKDAIVGQVLPKIIPVPEGYYVAFVKDVKDGRIVADVLLIKRVPFQEFIDSEAARLKIATRSVISPEREEAVKKDGDNT